MTDNPTGFQGFDLKLPSKVLAPVWEPLKHQTGQSAAAWNEARREARERPERIRLAGEAAVDAWTAFRGRHAGNPLAVAVLDVHQPVVEYDRIVCQECRESDLDDTVGVEWECPTFAAMKEADDSARPEPTADTGRFDDLLADIRAADGARLLKLGQQVALAHLEEHAISEAQYRELDTAWRDQVKRLMLPSDARAADA